MNRAETGRRGEAAAARWYQKQGAQLLAHNYHTRMGELDLVLREPDGTIVICEVKTRSQGMLQRPAAAVDPAKQHRLICAAQEYLQQTGQSEEPVRFDVAEVVPLDSGRWMVHIIKGAFLCRPKAGTVAPVGSMRQNEGFAVQPGTCPARSVAKRSDDHAVFQYQRSEPQSNFFSGNCTGAVR
ncbi:MAG: YraN family protein [Faecalibacterium sp.]